MIQIIGGKYRSRLLEVPEKGTVPTKSRVREALFSALGTDVDGANCLDLFAGSGALGFEALSRGASHVDFVDSSEEAIGVVRGNAARLKENACSFHLEDAFSFIKKKPGPYDIVFLDPPYEFKEAYLELPPRLLAEGILSMNGILVVESEEEKDLASLPGTRERTYNYGRTYVRIVRR